MSSHWQADGTFGSSSSLSAASSTGPSISSRFNLIDDDYDSIRSPSRISGISKSITSSFVRDAFPSDGLDSESPGPGLHTPPHQTHFNFSESSSLANALLDRHSHRSHVPSGNEPTLQLPALPPSIQPRPQLQLQLSASSVPPNFYRSVSEIKRNAGLWTVFQWAKALMMVSSFVLSEFNLEIWPLMFLLSFLQSEANFGILAVLQEANIERQTMLANIAWKTAFVSFLFPQGMSPHL